MKQKIPPKKLKKTQKLFLGLIILVPIALIIVIIWWAAHPKNYEKIILSDGTIIPAQICSKLQRVTVIHQSGCIACAVALPRLQEIEKELNMSFGYYDLAINNEKEAILALNLIPQAVPTVIIDCKVYVGVRSKEEYKSLILEY